MDAERTGEEELSLKHDLSQSNEDFELDKTVVRELVQTCKSLAIHHFTSFPFTVALTLLTDESIEWHWALYGVWFAGMLFKMGLATRVAYISTAKLYTFAGKHRLEATRQFLGGQSRQGYWSWLVPDWAQKALFGLPLYIDVDLDTATAMNAIMLSNAETRRHWVESWQKVPYVGPYVAELGLPFAMTALVILATLAQLKLVYDHLGECSKRLEEWPRASDRSSKAWKQRFLLWQQMGALCDVSSNVLMGEACQQVCVDFCEPWELAEIADGTPKPHKPPGRGAKFTAKIVYEAAPQMWLQVSFVAHAYGSAQFRTIITGAAAVLTGLCTMFGEIKRNLARMINLWGFIQGKAYEVFRMVVVVFIAVACSVRFAGIGFCDDHIFNLTGGCVDMD
mmetsp:Transcript_109542/g.172725  ORF Transcript_109542/g.172725 Transcript_109542/m.172725 type:complete len:394 (-) Transcript_109542:9-1190(-)